MGLAGSHDAGYGEGEFGVLLGFEGELLTAGFGDFVDAGAAIVGGDAPDAVDPAVQFEALEGGVEGAFLDEEFVVRGLLDVLDDAVAVEVAEGKGAEDEHVQGAGEGVVLLGLAGHVCLVECQEF